jgi:hypothetical protein
MILSSLVPDFPGQLLVIKANLQLIAGQDLLFFLNSGVMFHCSGWIGETASSDASIPSMSLTLRALAIMLLGQ